MARISTGQTFGETGRATAARLLGGAQQTGTPGVLGQTQINAPGLQPQAAPVETFQQVGAPTLGGPVKMFAPPELPPPNQDLANLAKSLGSFNAALQDFGEAAIKRQKSLSEERQQEAQQFVAQASQFGSFGAKAELHKNLEKAAAGGNKDAQRLLQYMLSRHPGMMTYVDDAVGEAGVVNRVTMLPEVMKNARDIPDLKGGTVDIRTLRQSDPAYQAFLAQNLTGGLSLSAKTYGKYQAAIVNAQAQEYKRQEDAFYARQRQDQDIADNVKFDSLARAAQFGLLTPEAFGREMTVLGDKRYAIDADGGKGWRESLDDKLVNALVSLPEDTPQEVQGKLEAYETFFQGLKTSLTGPPDQRYDKNGEARQTAYLVSALGGRAWLQGFRAKILAKQNQLISVRETADRNAGEDYGQNLGTQLFTPDVINNPAALDRTYQQGLQQIETQFRNRPVDQKNAAISALNSSYSNYKTGFSEPIRQKQEAALRLQLITAADQGPKALGQVEQNIQTAVRQDPSLITRLSPLLSQIETRKKAENVPLFAEADSLRKGILKRWDEQSKTSESWDQGAVGNKEIQMRASANRRMQERFQQIITDGRKNNLTPEQISSQLQKEAQNNNFGLQQPFKAPADRAAYRSLKEANQGFGPLEWATGGVYNPNDKRNQSLKVMIKSRPVTTQDELGRQMDDLLEGKPMDSELKNVLRRTGMNISDYFMYQMRQQQYQQRDGRVRNMWTDMDDATKERLRELDSRRSQLLSQGGDNQPRSQNTAMAPVQPFRQAVRQLADVALGVAPAQAATPLATAAPMIRTWTPGKPLRAMAGRGTVNGYLKRLAYLETRIRNIPNAEGSDGQGYFQAFGPFNQEATQASGIPMGARNPNYELAARATWAWIQRFNPQAAQAVVRGDYSRADRLLRNTWPSLPGGSQAQSLQTQREALRYLNL